VAPIKRWHQLSKEAHQIGSEGGMAIAEKIGK
jgi:hypothetical protein